MTAARTVSEDQRRRMIADTAYFRAERRGFDGGDPVADWIEAEAEVDARLRAAGSGGASGTLDERLATANESLAALRAKLADVTSTAAEEWRQDVERLSGLRDSLKLRLDEVREYGGHAAEQAQQRAEKIWEEISELLRRFASRRKDSDRAP